MENIQENTQATLSTPVEEKVVSTSAILQMLHSGKTRKEIKEELGLTGKQMFALFQTPGLKGRKTITPKPGVVPFRIVDDLAQSTNTEATTQPTVTEGLVATEETPVAPAPEAPAAADAGIIEHYEAQEIAEDRPPFERD